MKLSDLFSYALGNLAHRKLRSWLTVLGIVIGMASIVSLVSLAQGLSDDINSQLSEFGSTTIAIVPGDIGNQLSMGGGGFRPPSAGKLFIRDAQRIGRLPGIKSITSAIQVRTNAQYRDSAITITAIGVEPSLITQTQLLEIERGRFLVDTDKHAAVVGYSFTDGSIFKEKLQVGNIIKMGSGLTPYRVVGTLKKGTGGFGSNVDNIFYITIKDSEDLAGESLADNEISAIRLVVEDGTNVSETVELIEQQLLASHKLKEDEKDFSIITSEFLLEQVSTITSLLTLFLGGISAISLLVGGVGVANTMFMSVLERTKEIGTLKALGASQSAISQVFLLESALIGTVGGIFGSLLGALVAYIATFAGVPATISPFVIAFAIVFSFIVGLVSGWIPASRAAKMNPVEALSFE